jgi:hypothetical protein
MLSISILIAAVLSSPLNMNYGAQAGTSTTTQTKPQNTYQGAGEPEPAFLQCLRAHNHARKDVNVPRVTWSSTLAASAESHANFLKYQNGDLVHSTNRGGIIGENLDWNGGVVSCEKAVDYWLAEKSYFTPNTLVGDGLFEEYSHYSQIVYEPVTQIGCSSDTGKYFVCHYDHIQITGTPVY